MARTGTGKSSGTASAKMANANHRTGGVPANRATKMKGGEVGRNPSSIRKGTKSSRSTGEAAPQSKPHSGGERAPTSSPRSSKTESAPRPKSVRAY